jgi:hypothetical protein
MSDNGFGEWALDSLTEALSNGNSWFFSENLLFIEHSNSETVCLSGLELLPDFSVTVKTQTCSQRASLVALEAFNSAKHSLLNIVLNAKAIAAYERASSSANQSAFVAIAVSEASGLYNKPSKKFLKGKGVFKSGNFTVYAKKGTYKLVMIQTIGGTDTFSCAVTAKNKLSKLSKVTCRPV